MRKVTRKPYNKRRGRGRQESFAFSSLYRPSPSELQVNPGGELLQRSISQWQFGAWDRLVQIKARDIENFFAHRGEIALLVGIAHQQLGRVQAAESWIERAEEWGVERSRAIEMMLAGVHGTLAEAALAAGDSKQAGEFLRTALQAVKFGGDIELVIAARQHEEIRRMSGDKTSEENAEATLMAQVEMDGAENFPSIFTLPMTLDGKAMRARFNSPTKNLLNLKASKVLYKAPPDARIYAITSSTGGYENPGVIQFPITSAREYVLDAFLDCDGTEKPALWVFEYCGGKKVGAKNIELENGKATIRFTTHEGVDGLAIGIRLAGEGYFDCDKSLIKLDRSLFSVEKIGKEWVREHCEQEFKSQSFSRFNERAVEFSFIFRNLTKYYPKKILDVGSGTTALPQMMRNIGALVTAIDNVADYWPEGMVNRHYHVINDDITKSRLTDSYDFISCVSVLEHIENFNVAISGMVRLLAPTGLLALSFPYNEKKYVHNVYLLPGSSYGKGAPYITQAYSRKQIDEWIECNNLELVDQEYWKFWSGEFWTVGEQIVPPLSADKDSQHQLTCLLFRKKK